MPLQATSGAASYDAFGGGVAAVPQYIEDVFSTYLYTGNGSTQTITNGIDLSTKGGLVWLKNRTGTYDHWLWDTARGAGYTLRSNLTNAQANIGTTEGVSFTTSGFSMGNNINWNGSSLTATSWTFRKQPKFFDVVTFTTAAGGADTVVSHSLGSTPGCIIIKNTQAADNWPVYHRGLPSLYYKLFLNSTGAQTGGTASGGAITALSSTTFTANGNQLASSNTHVAYVFAHDAGGFGLTGTDNVISCGSYTGNGSATGPIITLGYEPQWVMIKNASDVGNWVMSDNMRNWSVTNAALLYANLTNAEATNTNTKPLATGFQPNDTSSSVNTNGATYIYIAIRRGPMKVPTDATKVFGMSARSGTGANATVTGGQTDDAVLVKNRGSAVASLFSSRLTGTGYLVTSATDAEVAAGTTILQANPWDVMDGVKVGTTSTITNASGSTFINYLFKRAPNFFDVVCYSGAGSTISVTHNLGVKPNLILIKSRNNPENWIWLTNDFTSIGGNGSGTNFIQLYGNLTNAAYNRNYSSTTYLTATPTSTTIPIGWAAADALADVNTSGWTYVAYLFATLAGVSKFGSYTGTATTLQIDCGFTGGARFVLIKRTDSTGDWYVWDSARGIVSGNDPYLLLNSTAAEVTSTDYIDTYSAGFEISSTAPAAINASGGKFIFLAIA